MHTVYTWTNGSAYILKNTSQQSVAGTYQPGRKKAETEDCNIAL